MPILRLSQKQPAYSDYELAHTIYRERIAGKLLSEERISERQVNTVKKLLGRLYYSPPTKIRLEKLASFDALRKQLGNERMQKLLERIEGLWAEYRKELDGVRNAARIDHVTKNTDSYSKVLGFGDAFYNPISGRLCYEHKITVEGVRRNQEKMVQNQSERYTG